MATYSMIVDKDQLLNQHHEFYEIVTTYSGSATHVSLNDMEFQRILCFPCMTMCSPSTLLIINNGTQVDLRMF